MKRYKDCALVCHGNQRSIDLLDAVVRVAKEKGYKTRQYPIMVDRVSVAVYMKEERLPYSRLIISNNTEANTVDIVNIVPMRESGISHIDYDEYNRLLDIFRDKVFKAIKERQGNSIRENTEDYEIADVIPSSFVKLDQWLSNFPLSGHPLDVERWNAFVVALHTSNEQLSLSVFERYIQEKYGWEEDVIEQFSLKLESQLELLEYYDEHR